MDIATAEIFASNHFACGCLDQWRATEKNCALITHNNGFIRHGRYIGTPCGTAAHDHCNLRYAFGRHLCLIIENPAKMVAVWKYFILERQESSSRVYQIDAGQPVLLGNFLGPKVFFDCKRIIGTTFNCGVIGNNHALYIMHLTNTGNYTSRRYIIVIQAIGSQLANFQKRAACI